MSSYVGAWLAVAAAACVLVAIGPVLRRLPPPADDDPPDYAALATPAFGLAAAALALLAGIIVAWRDPHPWLWLPLVLILVPACVIDARTTFLPLRMTQAAWLASALAVGTTAVGAADPALLVRAGVGAAALGGCFWLAWRLGAVGFGDVRLMFSVGAVVGGASLALMLNGLVVGALIGAGWGLLRLAVGRGRGPFPYGPSLLAGPFVALALGAT